MQAKGYVSEILLHVVPVGQLGSLFIRQGGDVLLPTGAPAGVPAPDTAQKRLGIVVVPIPEAAILTIVFRHSRSSSVLSGIA